MRLYLIRHGESQADERDSIRREIADEKIELTPTGRDQAIKAGNWLTKYLAEHSSNLASKVVMRHSPYARAAHTARLIREQLQKEFPELPMREDVDLREQNLGAFAGYTLEERAKLFPAEHEYFQKEWAAGRSYWAPRPNGERRKDVADRMDSYIPEILKDAADGVTDSIIVGHGIAHRLLVKQLTGKSVEEFDREPNPGNCHIRMLEIHDNGKIEDHGYIYAPERLTSKILPRNRSEMLRR
jgi:broad specificity phosphatase PhoE